MTAIAEPKSERRRANRRLALIVAKAQLDGKTKQVVCTNVSETGGFFASTHTPAIGSEVELTMRAADNDETQILIVAEVMRHVPAGGGQQPGFGVRWRSASCTRGADALHQWLMCVVQVAVPGPIAVVTGGVAQFQFRRPSDPVRPAVADEGQLTQCDGGRPMVGLMQQAILPLLADRYDEIAFLGEGGSGIVFRGRDKRLDRPVVLKFLARCETQGSDAARQFEREAQLAASLNHPNIVQVYDAGLLGGVPYYAMEFIAAKPLTDCLELGRPLTDTGFIVAVIRQLGAALDYAHGRGILHRDVKPGNIAITAEGVLKLFDFGLARRASDDSGNSTIVGTPFYMAPELCRGDAVDHRVDIYALGILLYRMLTGVLPFTEGEVLLSHVFDPLPDPRQFRANLPAPAVALLHRVLAKNPADRPNNCKEIVQRLASALAASTTMAYHAPL